MACAEAQHLRVPTPTRRTRSHRQRPETLDPDRRHRGDLPGRAAAPPHTSRRYAATVHVPPPGDRDSGIVKTQPDPAPPGAVPSGHAAPTKMGHQRRQCLCDDWRAYPALRRTVNLATSTAPQNHPSRQIRLLTTPTGWAQKGSGHRFPKTQTCRRTSLGLGSMADVLHHRSCLGSVTDLPVVAVCESGHRH
jgi:hypothetical protein